MSMIQTERLIIRTFGPDDLLAIHGILGQSFAASAGLEEADALRRRESWLRWSILS